MKRIELLDYGRLIAALSVVMFHYFFNGIGNGKISSIGYYDGFAGIAKYGYLGVEFFFVISGYVIFFSSRDRMVGDFAAARALRLFPAFWAAVLFTSIAAQFWGGNLMAVSLAQFFANLTMIPGFFNQGYVDGVYWTLQYELGFYVLVSVALLLRLHQLLDSLFIAWPFLLFLSWVSGFSHLPYLGGYCCYFAAGAVFAISRFRRDFWVVLSILLSFFLCLEYSVGGAVAVFSSKKVVYSPYIIVGIISVQFAFFGLLVSRWGQTISLPGSSLAGGMTYPIYLIHAHFGYMLLSRLATHLDPVVAYVVVFFLVICIAYFLHAIIEIGLADFWRKFFDFFLKVPLNFLSDRLSLAFVGKSG